ncbi:N-acetyltransferase [Leptolyngbya sp. FACHB-261]|uniref:GNAT family N-acetyltransferase n=1 Tax=Leptolyngbya sp. FACHB-261 TaxID=2692806 RepID=UPI001684604D|nr:GNAT family N-acetyltransferase [Leptolyngbya sp. FACHB-261]MBD2101177.1 GNAT family N-acetyltransferase [Leptolyngbya sp. FACHB-261]
MLPGYRLRLGTGLDRALLLKFLQRSYQELLQQRGISEFNLGHLAKTVDTHFAKDTPLWLVEQLEPQRAIGCLWLGTGIDQVYGDRVAYVFLIYVEPEHRRQGIATALIKTGEAWAQTQAYRQVSLQVFADNPAALSLYERLGYQPLSLMLQKPLRQEPLKGEADQVQDLGQDLGI